MMHKVLILSSHHDVLPDAIRQAGMEPFIYLGRPIADISEQDRLQVAGIVTSNAYFLTCDDIDLFPHLKFIARLGSGMEIIDTAYCSQKNIICWSSPMGNANAVAEHALAMLLSINNLLRKSHIEILNQQFLRKENTCHELSDLHVGIIGLGSNGKAFAEKLLSLGCRVSAHDTDPSKTDAICHPHFSFCSSVQALQACNAISLHIPLNDGTRHYIDQAFVDEMSGSFILINCARGPLADTRAIADGLRSGKLTGAGIDVWEYEPISDYPADYTDDLDYILRHPMVIATPHIAGYSYEATYKMSRIISEKIKKWADSNLDILK